MQFDHIFILAFIQGFSEFLPISSSGHLNLLHALSAYPAHSLYIDIALHGGTLIAVLTYFRHDVLHLLQGGVDILQRHDSKAATAAWQIIIASIPIVIVGALFVLSGVADKMRSPFVIAWASILFAIPLYLADRFGANHIDRNTLGVTRAFWIGCVQIFALIPGASRAGVTIMAARAMGVERREATAFSMLLACPVIFIFTIAGFIDLIRTQQQGDIYTALIGAGIAALIALATIHIFLKLTTRLSLLPFILYRIGLGIVLLAIL